MKRTVQVNVKMTEEDFALLRKAAEERWRDAVMTNSGSFSYWLELLPATSWLTRKRAGKSRNSRLS
jgi:hypothetical protein